MCCMCLFTNIKLHRFFGRRKVTHEFVKRIDPDLPFFYSTSSHSRFYEGEMPDLMLPNNPPRERRLPQRELLGANNGVTLSIRNSASICTKFHNLPIDLPPPPGQHNYLTDEHSYCIQK